jgi:hypothetical protein
MISLLVDPALRHELIALQLEPVPHVKYALESTRPPQEPTPFVFDVVHCQWDELHALFSSVDGLKHVKPIKAKLLQFLLLAQ